MNCKQVFVCRFIKSLLGHVQRVYEVSWSADSRLLCSSSADSTIKVWDVATCKLLYDLPGHSDEVLSPAYTALDLALLSFMVNILGSPVVICPFCTCW